MSNFQRPPGAPPGQRPGQAPGRPGAPGQRPGAPAGQPGRSGGPGLQRPGAPAQRGGNPAGKGPPPKTANPAARNLEPEFTAISGEITRFRVDVQRFFAGDLHIPPEELRDRIAATLKKLRNGGVRGAAENFRLTSIEAQFNSQLDLYTRKMREREMGGQRRTRPVEPPPPDPLEGVVFGRSGPANAVEILYKGLYLQAGQRNPGMDLERFRDYVGRQAEAIRAKTGCSDIQFRVEVEEGKLKLKAKPLR